MLPTDGPPTPDENANTPAAIHSLVGVDKRLRENWLSFIRDVNGVEPAIFTGEVDGDPRDRSIYPEDPKEMASLLNPEVGAGSVLEEELSMAVQAVQAQRTDAFPPMPLTPTRLDDLLSMLMERFEGEYEAWVALEPETVDDTAVGEYREAVPGSILRFYLFYEETASIFTLLPDTSPGGFSWYHLSTQPEDSTPVQMVVESAEAQSLQSLLQEDGDRILQSVPDRIANASTLLGTYINTADPSPTPDGWLTTQCELADEAKLLNPRYNASFVHKAEDIVLEVSPLPAEGVIEGGEETADSLKVELDGEELDKPTHTWELHFADEDVKDAVHEEYEQDVKGVVLMDMMETISEHV